MSVTYNAQQWESGYNERQAATDAKFNEPILAARVAALNECVGPRVGDFVKVPADPWWGEGGYHRFSYDWGDGLQHSCGGSFYLGSSGCGMSGTLYSSIPLEKLRLTDEVKLGAVWFFNRGISGAGRGVDFMIPFRVYEVI